MIFPCGADLWPALLLLLAGGLPRVPGGFVIDRAAGEPQIIFPMFAAFDDRGRLYVAESSGLNLYAELKALTRKCRVSVLEDRDGDGRFETSTVFADKLVFPMGLAWRDGKLYVADPPDVILLEDVDGDGTADRRTKLLGDFGHEDNGSLHGLVFGPDGLLYMTMGEPDGYRLDRGDGTVLEGKSGALIRSRPDGSRPEVLCRGFVNLVEIVFLPSGEVIGTDNWFTLPEGGARDALVHLADGGLYPRMEDQGTRYPVTGPPLPAVAMFPAVALSGLVRYRGVAFPREMQGSLFTAQHNARKVARHVLTREGSTFHAESFDFVTSDDPDFHPSDVLEDADGSLIVVDTGGWYVQHCPTGKIRDSRAPGGIYRVKRAGAARIEDPWGLRVDWVRASPAELCGLLGDERPAVRERAQRGLSARGDAVVPALAAVLERSAVKTAKEHAAWALKGVAGEAALAPLRRLLRDADPDLASLAARILALREDRRCADELCRLLEHGEPHVRLAAAEGIARCGSESSAQPLVDALASGEPDRFLEHALVHALHRVASQAQLESALRHASPRVRKAALILLDQPPRSGAPRDAVIAGVSSPDPGLREAAMRILANHAEWAEPASRVVRALVKKKELTGEDALALRGLVVAFAPSPVLEEVITQALELEDAGGETPDATRRFIIEAISGGGITELPRSWVDAIGLVIRRSPPEVRTAAVHAAATLQMDALDGDLSRLAEDSSAPEDLRVQACGAVLARHPAISSAVFDLLVSHLDAARDPLSRMAAAETLARSRLEDARLERFIESVRGDALIAPRVLLPVLTMGAVGKAAPAIASYLEAALRAGWRPKETELRGVADRLPPELAERGRQLLELAKNDNEALRERLRELEPLLQGGDASRGREVFFGKKAACSTRHRIGREGGQVGPDLTKIGAVRSGRDILESIVVPSSTFAQGFENWSVVTRDGQAFGGIIARQTPGVIVLRSASGAETQVRRDALASIERQETSIMPEGLERNMTREELQDVLMFLLSLK